MDRSRWERIEALFHGAADLPSDEQRTFLKSACGDDGALLSEVQSLLAGDAQGARVLDRGLAETANQVLAEAPRVMQDIGPYRIEDKLGEGGMGIVYLASRRDLGNRVAIKTLRDAWLSPLRRERFAREERTLAELTHPYIARLYDADVLPDGTPYFVMEYVDGIPITEYCRRRQSSIEERLGILRRVCEAVQFAHGHAVIHRDLKPSNILVQGDASVKLLDFGIAKHVENLDVPVDQTRSELRLMTPAYAAPEQIRGERVGVQTDVYALGVILYELLAGRLPFDLTNRTPAEAESIVVSRDPERPSVLAGTAGRAAWADLDVLCLTAMHKDLERRYRSIEALVRDIDHYVRGEPLESRPDSLRYRLGKFVARNRRAVVTIGGMLALAVGLAVFATVRITRARDAAVAEAHRAEQVQKFMVNLLEGGEASSGPSADLRVLTVLDRGAKEAGGLTTEPRTKAVLYDTLGTMYQRLGQLDRSDQLLQQSLAQFRALGGPDDPDVGKELVALGLLRLDQGKTKEAETLVRQGLAIERRLLPRDHPAVASALFALGSVLLDAGRYDDAIGVLEEVVALRSKPGVPVVELADVLGKLGEVHNRAIRYERSVALNEQALSLYESQLGPRHPLVADRLKWLGETRRVQGRGDEAVKYDRRALDIVESWYGHEHPRTANALVDLAQALTRSKRFDEAEPLLRDALAIQERLRGERHPDVANTLAAMAYLNHIRGRFREAAELNGRAAEVFRLVYGERHPEYGIAVDNMGTAYLRDHQWTLAETSLRRSLDVLTLSLPPGSLGRVHCKLGLALAGQGRLAEAWPYAFSAYQKGKKMKSQTWDPTFWRECVINLADAYDALGAAEPSATLRAELMGFGEHDAGVSP